MYALNMLPAEQIASMGWVVIDGVMQKQFFYDAANVLNINAYIRN